MHASSSQGPGTLHRTLLAIGPGGEEASFVIEFACGFSFLTRRHWGRRVRIIGQRQECLASLFVSVSPHVVGRHASSSTVTVSTVLTSDPSCTCSVSVASWATQRSTVTPTIARVHVAHVPVSSVPYALWCYINLHVHQHTCVCVPHARMCVCACIDSERYEFMVCF